MSARLTSLGHLLHRVVVNPFSILVGLTLLASLLYGLAKLPYTEFLFRRLRQGSWPTTNARVTKAGVISTTFDRVQWHSAFQVSYLAKSGPTVGYFALRFAAEDPDGAKRSQTAWDGAEVSLRYDPHKPEIFVLASEVVIGNDVIYLPEFAGPSIAGSPDPLHLPKRLGTSASNDH